MQIDRIAERLVGGIRAGEQAAPGQLRCASRQREGTWLGRGQDPLRVPGLQEGAGRVGSINFCALGL